MIQFRQGLDAFINQAANFRNWCNTPLNSSGFGYLFNFDLSPVGILMNTYVRSQTPILLFFNAFLSLIILRLVFGLLRLINPIS